MNNDPLSRKNIKRLVIKYNRKKEFKLTESHLDDVINMIYDVNFNERINKTVEYKNGSNIIRLSWDSVSRKVMYYFHHEYTLSFDDTCQEIVDYLSEWTYNINYMYTDNDAIWYYIRTPTTPDVCYNFDKRTQMVNDKSYLEDFVRANTSIRFGSGHVKKLSYKKFRDKYKWSAHCIYDYDPYKKIEVAVCNLLLHYKTIFDL